MTQPRNKPLKSSIRAAYILTILPLAGCGTLGYQEDPRHGVAVREAVERQTHQAIIEGSDPELLHCMMIMRQRGYTRGQDGESARAPLQRYQRELHKPGLPQDIKPLVNQ